MGATDAMDRNDARPQENPLPLSTPSVLTPAYTMGSKGSMGSGRMASAAPPPWPPCDLRPMGCGGPIGLGVPHALLRHHAPRRAYASL